MPKPRHLALSAALLLVGAFSTPARGEIAVMESGKILYIDRFERSDKQVTLFLTGGGEVTVSADIVANIVPNEIVEEEKEDPQQAPLFPHLHGLIDPAASKYGVDRNLVAAVIWAESSGDPNAVSSRGARGLMQLMPETARSLGIKKLNDPRENVEGGTRYLRQLLDEQEGDVKLALAAYNAGPEAVRRYRGIPPFKETQDYVGKVYRVYRRAQELAE